MFTSTVTTLIENYTSDHKALACEHGLSFHINTLGMNILFDCGASGKVIDNADALNIDLGNLDLVVLSHGHYDHGNGFRAVAEKSRVKRLVTGQGYFLPKFSHLGIYFTNTPPMGSFGAWLTILEK